MREEKGGSHPPRTLTVNLTGVEEKVNGKKSTERRGGGAHTGLLNAEVGCAKQKKPLPPWGKTCGKSYQD